MFLFTGCTKEKDVLTGDIRGRIIIYEEDGSLSDKLSGVLVNLFQDTTLIDTSFTDLNGQYILENIPYGRYNVDVIKDGYIKAYWGWKFFHVGGYNPTLADIKIYKIPTFQLTIDSVEMLPYYELKIYLKVNGDTILPFSSSTLRGYLSNSPDVSKDNYSSVMTGYLSQDPRLTKYDKIAAYGRLTEHLIYSELTGTVYLRLYPMAPWQVYHTLSTAALGNPSNTVSFIWE